MLSNSQIISSVPIIPCRQQGCYIDGCTRIFGSSKQNIGNIGKNNESDARSKKKPDNIFCRTMFCSCYSLKQVRASTKKVLVLYHKEHLCAGALLHRYYVQTHSRNAEWLLMPRNFISATTSSCRTRSREMPSSLPTSSRVRLCPSPIP